jgi:hypothetical protein
MAYTSSAIPSMMKPNNTSALTGSIGDYETTWMSKTLFIIFYDDLWQDPGTDVMILKLCSPKNR